MKKASSGMRNLEFEDYVTQYNDCYFICKERKKLKEKGLEILEIWIKEVEEELEKLNQIKL